MEKSYTSKITRVHVLITDLTYMRNGVCIAGVNLDTLENIRPVRFSGNIQMDFIKANNIYPCAICTFTGMPKLHTTPPHTEDFSVRDSVSFRRFVSQNEWQELLQHSSSNSLPDRLNNSIQEDKWIAPGTEIPSLSLIKLETKPIISSITINKDYHPDIRASFTSGNSQFCLKVNDLQLVDFLISRHQMQQPPTYADDAYADDAIAAEQFLQEINNDLFQKDTYTYVRIGLTRPYQEKCWLQINGLYTTHSDTMIRKFSKD
ncbi:dual OB domain-containing protein [Candidatus Magnetominusculus dajiuhuensis]|uniref:dual OB domain-containing protein n=1 Tax=Candidatus Magnetominusculus dajiuhuensis TaxID=3137712 RepID=UPI0019F2E06B|nr:hypothetical protein [Nitrospirota bacterium]